jgi:hypothetical protein
LEKLTKHLSSYAKPRAERKPENRTPTALGDWKEPNSRRKLTRRFQQASAGRLKSMPLDPESNNWEIIKDYRSCMPKVLPWMGRKKVCLQSAQTVQTCVKGHSRRNCNGLAAFQITAFH